MKNKIIIILILAVAINMFGCGSKPSADNRPSDEEMANFSKVCGVVKDINEDVISIQLCGKLHSGTGGYVYLDVDNNYSNIGVDQNVLIYYEGEMRCEENDQQYRIYNLNVQYVEPYVNDGKFVATMALTGDLLTPGATIKNTVISVKPIQSEPELRFARIICTYDLANEKAIKDENGNTIYFDFEVEDISKEVTVTYDIETMEILSITQ